MSHHRTAHAGLGFDEFHACGAATEREARGKVNCAHGTGDLMVSGTGCIAGGPTYFHTF